jgi:hypothetical protein
MENNILCKFHQEPGVEPSSLTGGFKALLPSVDRTEQPVGSTETVAGDWGRRAGLSLSMVLVYCSTYMTVHTRNTYIYIHTYIHMHIYVHTYIHKDTYIHTHTYT